MNLWGLDKNNLILPYKLTRDELITWYRSRGSTILFSLPELHQNPLVQRVIEIFDQDGNGEVDFKEFIEGVSQFSVRGDKDSKLKCNYFLNYYFIKKVFVFFQIMRPLY